MIHKKIIAVRELQQIEADHREASKRWDLPEMKALSLVRRQVAARLYELWPPAIEPLT